MTSFFEKLKRGMGIEEPAEDEIRQGRPIEEKIKKESSPRPRKKNPKKLEIKTEPIEPMNEKQEGEEAKVSSLSFDVAQEIEEKEVEEEIKKSFPASPIAKGSKVKEKWFEPEGQLAIDVHQTEKDLVIQSAIAGVKPENLDVTIEGDLITIKGVREKLFEVSSEDYFFQECYWGPFSREIILPVEVDPNQIAAEMKEGILTIKIPKVLREKRRKIEIKG